MRWLRKIAYFFLRIAVPVMMLGLLLTAVDYLYSGSQRSLLVSARVSFTFTLSCSFFCSIFLVTFFETIYGYPRPVFFGLFTLLAAAGVFLGVIAGFLILEGRFGLRWNTLIFSLIMGIAFSAVISGYILLRHRIEQKMARIREVELENEKLKRIESEARLNDLRAKLNPHFLFNVLNTTAALVYDDPVKAEQSIVRLSSLYSRVLSVSGQAFVRIREELELVEDYLGLEKLRFDERLTYDIACPEELKNETIPSLVIEPLVENVVKHNLEHSPGAVRLKVGIEERDDRLIVTVEDNGRGFEVQRAGFGFGLFSVQERLRLLYGDNQAFDIVSEKDRGTTVSIQLPRGQS